MLGQIIAAEKDTGERISNVVMMGIGEPLDNYDNTIRFLKLVSSDEGLNIGLRHISLSTCGLVNKIERLWDEGLPITLSVSLHAYDNEVRSGIMPVNNKYPIEDLLRACDRYFKKTGRRISFEYTLISGKNDTVEGACRLASVLKRYIHGTCHVNLIPLNEVEETGLKSSANKNAYAFMQKLNDGGISATVRRLMGSDIEGACGQLRNKYVGGNNN
jgi:23S rRNA (adenine2503-C2)-methyltransferase